MVKTKRFHMIGLSKIFISFAKNERNMTNIKFETLKQPNTEIYGLLANTIYGTKGLRYRHCDSEKRIDNLFNPDFHVAYADDKLAGCIVFCRRVDLNRNQEIFYIRFFSVQPELRGNGIGKKLVEYAGDYYSKTQKLPAVFYAYIENENIRSMKVSKNMESMKNSQFKTVLFSRFNPKKSNRVEKIDSVDYPIIEKQLKAHYAIHSLFHLNTFSINNPYYVIRKNGEILAGIQSNNVKWEIVNIPGFNGFLMQKIIPRLPYLRKLFNPKSFEFISLENIIIKKGHEADFFELLEGVMHDQNGNMAMTWLDTSDPMISAFTNKKELGFISRIQEPTPANIMLNFHDMDETGIAHFTNNPAYISAIDLT